MFRNQRGRVVAWLRVWLRACVRACVVACVRARQPHCAPVLALGEDGAAADDALQHLLGLHVHELVNLHRHVEIALRGTRAFTARD